MVQTEKQIQKEKKKKRPVAKPYTLGEEIFNSVSHGVGAGLSIAALVVMIVKAALTGNAYMIVSASIFGAMMILLYTMSTLYHALTNQTAKKVFRIFDHCTIFLLIAGTYTPYTLVTLHGAVGWTLFGILWGFAVLGIVFNAIDLQRFKKVSVVCYIIMGWSIVFAIRPLLENLALGGLIFLLAGGIFYTVGVVFYALKKVRYMHSIWHLFVLGGTICHFFSILFWVIQ